MRFPPVIAALLLSACGPADPGIVTDRPVPPAVDYTPRIKGHSEEDTPALRARAAKGDTWAMGHRAFLLAEGKEAPPPEAMALVRRAAEAGDVQAQALLGEWLNPSEEGMKWVRLAAEKCYPGAEFDMGWAYAEGWGGTPVDREEARYWFARAKAHGHPNAESQGQLALSSRWAEKLVPTWLDEKIKDWSWSFNVGGDRPRPR